MAPPRNSLASARQFLASGDLQQAERAYSDVIAEEPETVEAWEFLIRRRIESMSRFDAADDFLRRAIALHAGGDDR